jgi:hypothetical protein
MGYLNLRVIPPAGIGCIKSERLQKAKLYIAKNYSPFIAHPKMELQEKQESSGRNYFIRRGPNTKYATNNSSVIYFVFVAAVTCAPSSCQTTIRGYMYRHTEG